MTSLVSCRETLKSFRFSLKQVTGYTQGNNTASPASLANGLATFERLTESGSASV